MYSYYGEGASKRKQRSDDAREGKRSRSYVKPDPDRFVPGEVTLEEMEGARGDGMEVTVKQRRKSERFFENNNLRGMVLSSKGDELGEGNGDAGERSFGRGVRSGNGKGKAGNDAGSVNGGEGLSSQQRVRTSGIIGSLEITRSSSNLRSSQSLPHRSSTPSAANRPNSQIEPTSHHYDKEKDRQKSAAIIAREDCRRPCMTELAETRE